MEIIKSNTPKKCAGETLTQILLQNADIPILLMLSGGSSFTLLEHVDPACIGPHVTITTLDERFTADLSVNNFGQLKETTFYKNAMTNGANIIASTINDNDTLELAGNRFESALQEWKRHHLNGLIIATMGIGNNGHTAGIFPDDHGVDFNGSDWVAAYTVPESVNQYTERITVTYTFLRDRVDTAIVYAIGPEKKKIIEMIQQPDCDIEQVPACILRELTSVTVVTD
ncbi:MAG: 6-phosphogluconolactonase [Candidatus Paceibacterota bacterium]